MTARSIVTLIVVLITLNASAGLRDMVAGITGAKEKSDKVIMPGKIQFIVSADPSGYAFEVAIADSEGTEKKVLANVDSIVSLSLFRGQVTGLANVTRVPTTSVDMNEPNWFFIQSKDKITLFYKGENFDTFVIPGRFSEIRDFSFSMLRVDLDPRTTLRKLVFSLRDMSGHEMTSTIDYMEGSNRAPPVLRGWANKYFKLDPQLRVRSGETMLDIGGTRLNIIDHLGRSGITLDSLESKMVKYTTPSNRLGGSEAGNKQDYVAAAIEAARENVSEDGKTTVPLKNSIPVNATFELSHNGDTFQLYSVDEAKASSLYPTIKDRGLLLDKVGVYVSRKSDGEIVKISPLPNIPSLGGDKHGFVIEDGILSHPNILRSIDLDNVEVETADGKKEILDMFQLEASFKPKNLNGRGSSAEARDDVSFVRDNFESFRSSTADIMEPINNRRAIVDILTDRIFSGESVKINLSGDSTDKELIMAEVARRMPRTWGLVDFNTSGFGDIGTTGQLQLKAGHINRAIQSVPFVFFSSNFLSFAGFGVSKGSDTDALQLLSQSFTDRRGAFKLISTVENPTDITERVKDVRVASSISQLPVPDMSRDQLVEYLNKFLGRSFPKVQIQRDELEYLIDKATSVKRVYPEPQRSEGLLSAIAQNLMNKNRKNFKEKKISIVTVDTSEVDRALTYFYGIPSELATEDGQIKTVNQYRSRMGKTVQGHEHLINVSEKKVRIGLGGLHSERGGMSMDWIDGPPGVGKTEYAKGQAKALRVPLGRVDMNNYSAQSQNASNDLLAEIAGYISKNPFSVILLDEIEKASPKILEGLLMALSETHFNYTEKDNSGKTVVRRESLNNATIIMTANTIGNIVQNWMKNKIASDPAKYDNMRADQLDEEFKKEYSTQKIKDILIDFGMPAPLVDRVDVHVAYPGSFDTMVKLIGMKLDEIKRSAKKNGYEFVLESGRLNEIELIKQHVRESRKNGETVRDSINRFHLLVADQAVRIREVPNYKNTKYFSVDPVSKTVRAIGNQCYMYYIKGK